MQIKIQIQTHTHTNTTDHIHSLTPQNLIRSPYFQHTQLTQRAIHLAPTPHTPASVPPRLLRSQPSLATASLTRDRTPRGCWVETFNEDPVFTSLMTLLFPCTLHFPFLSPPFLFVLYLFSLLSSYPFSLFRSHKESGIVDLPGEGP